MLASGYRSKVRIQEKYRVVGFISSGTYGRVYKAVGRNGQKGEFAIKKYVEALIRAQLVFLEALFFFWFEKAVV